MRGGEFVDQKFPDRLGSIDLFRGVVMFLLMGAATGLFDLFVAAPWGKLFFSSVGRQFQHAPWTGLRLFDLGQPFFMFISGAALALSYHKRWASGQTWKRTFYHCLMRAGLLFLLGWMLFHINSNAGATQATLYVSILSQLAFASIVAFLLLKAPIRLQIAVSGFVLVSIELLYRLWSVPGFDQPFVPGKNFGSYLDLKLFGKLSELNIVALNIVPATVYVIFGVIAARLLGGPVSKVAKLRWLIGSGAIGIASGLALSSATPIIRRLETSSFLVLALGLAFWALALGYWFADMRGLTKRSTAFIAIGRNPLFIFLFASTGGALWLRAMARPFSMGFVGWVGSWWSEVFTSLLIWAMLVGVSYFLHKRRILIRI